jgi:DNA-directed RNA polymerase specialized sigma24 family protein
MQMKPEALLANADFVRSLARSMVMDDHSADEILIIEQTRLHLMEAVMKLKAPYRTVILLRYYKERKIKPPPFFLMRTFRWLNLSLPVSRA